MECKRAALTEPRENDAPARHASHLRIFLMEHTNYGHQSEAKNQLQTGKTKPGGHRSLLVCKPRQAQLGIADLSTLAYKRRNSSFNLGRFLSAVCRGEGGMVEKEEWRR